MEHAIGLGLILTLRDRASAGLEAVRGKLTALRDVSQQMMKQFDEGAKQLVSGIASMVAGVKMFGLLNSTFGVSVNTAAEFEQAMAKVGAVSGAVGEDFERLSRQARDLGRDTQYSASQAANAQELLARAGFNTNEIISAMPNLLYMAGAEGMDMARAADIAAGTLRGFGLEASEMSRVANVLAKTSSSTNTSIDTLGESFKYVAPDAKALKVSIEEVAAIVGVMGDATIKGSQAGVYLRGAFNKLTSPTKDTQEALKKLGITIKDESGELKSFDTLMGEFSKKMQGMTGFQKKALFGEIFDARSSTGMLAVLTAFESGKLSHQIDDLYHVGDVAKQMYDRMSATAQGAMKRLESATEGLRIAVGNHLLSAYTVAIDTMARFKSWLTQLVEQHPIISKAVIGLTTLLLTLSGTALLVVGGLASIGGFIKMWPLLKAAAVLALSNIRALAGKALTSLAGLSVPVVSLIALAGVLYYAWRKNLWGIRDMVTAVAEGFKMALSASVDGIAEVDDELINKLKAAGIWDFAVTMGKVFFRVRMFWNGLVKGLKEGWDFIMEIFDGIKDFFSPVVKSGQQLLKFLGILKPTTKTQVDTWKAWGQLLGRLAPAIIAIIGAFKGFNVITGIFGVVWQAITSMFSLLMAHPVIAVIVALVAAGIYLYNHWDEITEDMARSFGWWADWVKQKWQQFIDWWNSWTLADVFAFLVDKAANVVEKVKKPFIELYDWIADKFSKLNPFNWELPAWLEGKKSIPTPEAEVSKQAIIQEHGTLDFTPSYMRATPAVSIKPPDVPATNHATVPQPTVVNIPPATTQNPIVNVPPAVQTTTVIPLVPETPAVNVLPAAQAVTLNPQAPLPPEVNVATPTPTVISTSVPTPPLVLPPAAEAAANVKPQTVQSPVVEVATTSPTVITPPATPPAPVLKSPIVFPEQQNDTALVDAVTDIERQLGTLAGRDVAPRFPAPQPQAQSSPLLIQHTQNQAAMTGQATVQAQAQAPDRPVKVENEVNVKVESKPVELVLDGERIGAFTLRWLDRQSVRSGVG